MALLDTPIIIDILVKASVVLAATAVLTAALRRATAATRHLLWTLGLVGALVAPVLTIALPRWEVPLVRIAPDPAPEAGRQGNAGVSGAKADVNAGRAPVLHGPTHEPSRASANAQPVRVADGAAHRSTPKAAWAPAFEERVAALSWPALLLIVWAAGALVILARMVLGLAAVQWISRSTPIIDAAPWLSDARALAQDLGIARVRFLRSRVGSMPMAWGIFRPSVLMPVDADRWPADRLRFVLLHELAHVKRRDCLTHVLAQLAYAAYWFNPLAWVAVKHMRTERERACDDLVLAAGTRGPDYADQLLEIARVMRAGRFPAVLAGATLAMAHRSQLEGRLIAILDPSVPRKGVSRRRAAIVSTGFAIALVLLASVQPWAREAPAPLPSAVPAALALATPLPIATPPAPSAKDGAEGPDQHDVMHGVSASVPQSLDGITQSVTQAVTQGVTQSVTQGVTQSITQGVTQSVTHDVAGGVVGGVMEGVAHGISRGIGEGVVHEAAAAVMEHGLPFVAEVAQEGRKGGAADPRTVAALTAALKDTDKDVRETALHALVQMRDPSVFEPLLTALKDASPDVREQAAFGLGQIRDRRAVEPLSAALKDADADVREQVVFALGQLRDPSTVDPLATALHDSNADVREQAAFALGQIRDRRAIDPLISALKDEKPDVREQAAFALGQIRDAKAVEALVIALKDANASVREQAAFALGQLRDPRAIDGLTAALKDANASVRQQAAFALGQIR